MSATKKALPKVLIAPPVREQGATDRLVKEMRRLGASDEAMRRADDARRDTKRT